MRGTFALALLLPLSVATPARADESPLTLEEAFRLALRNHETFRISEEALFRVRLLREKAWALLLPTLRIQGTFTIYDQPDLAFDLGGGRRVTFLSKNAFNGDGFFTMTLFDARSLPALHQTKIQARAAEQTTAFTQADLLYEVARAYFGVLAAQRLVEINRHTVQVNEEHLRDAQARLKAGELIKLAVTRAEIEVVKAKRELDRAENALKAGQALLAFLIGTRAVGRLTRPVPPATLRQGIPKLQAEALRARRDLAAAKHEIESARKGVDTAWGAFYPTLNVAATGHATHVTGFAGRILTAQTLFTLGWTIYDGGTRYAELKEKHSLLRESILKHSQLSRSIEREVTEAYLNLKTAESALFASKRELDLARENHAMVMARFRAGLATTIEAVDAATALATAEASVLREELNRDTMRVNLFRSIGADPIGSLTTTGSPSSIVPLFRDPNVRAAGAAPAASGGGR
jgi:outer membrane protein TolC